MLHYSHRYISSQLILRHWSPSGKIASSHVALRCHIRNFSNNNSKQKVVSSRSQNSEASQQVKQLSFLQRWMGPKEIPPRWTLPWYGEMTLICTVFAIAGSSTMFMASDHVLFLIKKTSFMFIVFGFTRFANFLFCCRFVQQ